MMFDPPDYPYKDLTESLTDQYDPDSILFSDATTTNPVSCGNKSLAEVTEDIILNVENQLTFQSNDSGRYFNLENTSVFDLNTSIVEQSTELYIVQSENHNYEPTLLDENTVNQFLLPLNVSSNGNKDTEDNGHDLSALQSCVICHEIFTTETDLLDHTISVHASDVSVAMNENGAVPVANRVASVIEENNSSSAASSSDLESEWLVCSICQRVLSTALEIEPNEPLCCDNGSGKGSASSRKLHTMYVCDLCSGLFADGEALDRHHLACYIQDQQNYYLEQPVNSTSTTQGPEVCFSCDVCERQFSSADELKIHAVECHRPMPRTERRVYTSSSSNKMWNCGSCNQLFATARELYRHKRGEDRPPGAPLMAYVCEECDKVLGSMCALHTHKKMHKVSKPGYPCRICGRCFNQSGHLAIHMRMHTGERPYPCDLCPKAFKVKVERDDHRRTHTGERPFACSACPKTFTAAARLREHARIHTDQRPYRCDICGAAFRRPYARTVHTLIHTGEKPHECDVCGTAFRRSGDMWKHKRTIHGVQAVSNDAESKIQ